ncbi:MAG: Lpg1974 family pore-forming outer membrane protein [Planctomycetota bacterium]|nr:Lpg1974 family pore-forming outer membrane protein [Planctomycetota bacterium]
MKRNGWLTLTLAAVCMLAPSYAGAADADHAVLDQQFEAPEVPSCAYACDDEPECGGAPVNVFVPNLVPGFEFSADLLYLRPGADNLGFATITTFLPLTNPQWAVQTLEPEYQPGFTIGAAYALPSSVGKDIQVNWEHLRTSDSSSVAVSDLSTQWISPFNQTGPSTSESANEVGIFHLKSADGQVEFDYDMINLVIGQTVNVGPHTQLRPYLGVSYVQLRQQLISRFHNNPNIVPVPPVIAIPDPNLRYVQLDNTSTYSGVGPRLGISSRNKLPHRFTFVGELSGAILAGWMQPAEYSFSGVFVDAVDTEQISSSGVSQVVYTGDAKLGLGYLHTLDNGSLLKIESGFKAAVFIDPFSTYETSTNVLPLDIGSLSTNSMRHTPSDFTLSGFYANVSLQW